MWTRGDGCRSDSNFDFSSHSISLFSLLFSQCAAYTYRSYPTLTSPYTHSLHSHLIVWCAAYIASTVFELTHTATLNHSDLFLCLSLSLLPLLYTSLRHSHIH